MGGSAEEELGAYGATSGTTTAHTNAARGKRQRGGGGGGKSGGNGGNGASATAGNSGKTGSNWTSALQSAVSSTPTNGSTSDRVVSILPASATPHDSKTNTTKTTEQTSR